MVRIVGVPDVEYACSQGHPIREPKAGADVPGLIALCRTFVLRDSNPPLRSNSSGNSFNVEGTPGMLISRAQRSLDRTDTYRGLTKLVVPTVEVGSGSAESYFVTDPEA